MIYLASPYSYIGEASAETKAKHRELRYTQTMAAQANLFNWGYPVFATIVHTHMTAVKYNLPTDAAFWMKYNHHMIDLSRAVFVLCLSGWQQSIGVTDEINYADTKNIPVYLIEVNPENEDTNLWMTIPIIPELQTLTKYRNAVEARSIPLG